MICCEVKLGKFDVRSNAVDCGVFLSMGLPWRLKKCSGCPGRRLDFTSKGTIKPLSNFLTKYFEDLKVINVYG